MKPPRRQRGGRRRRKELDLPQPRIETPTPEMLQKRDWRLEALEEGGVNLYRAVSQTPLDRYLARQQISPQEYEAGDRLYRLWFFAGRSQRITVAYRERIDVRLVDGFAVTRQDAWQAYHRALDVLPASLKSVVVAVAVHQEAAGDWAKRQGLPAPHGMGRLRAGLEDLARHWGLERSRERDTINGKN